MLELNKSVVKYPEGIVDNYHVFLLKKYFSNLKFYVKRHRIVEWILKEKYLTLEVNSNRGNTYKYTCLKT